MNRALLIAAAVGALSASAPAFAQPYGAGLGLGVGVDARDLGVRGDVGVRGYDNRGQVNGWQSINGRQAQLDARIDQGLRNGSLTRTEAARLRAEFRTIADLEARYRATGGVDMRERADLDRRFDDLSARIRVERADNQDRNGRGRGADINRRQAQLERSIEQGVRNRRLSASEAARLRADFRSLTVLESRYRASGGGLDARERADLDTRFDRLQAQIRVDLADRDFRWEDNVRYR